MKIDYGTGKTPIRMKNKNKGFTLIELLIALAVFSLVIVSMATTAVSIIKGQRKAFTLQDTQETGRFILESMSKEIRMSEVTTPAGSPTELNITNVDGDGDGAQDDDVDYRFLANKLQRRLNGGNWRDLTSDKLEVTGNFYVMKFISPERPGEVIQTRVTSVIKIKITGGKAEEQAEIRLQSTIVPRLF